ncbi:MAG: hypothetical protein HY674_05730 [Chloroflexi bacterium]|nr:hypothetical protein [Chloroflexota bacterium]
MTSPENPMEPPHDSTVTVENLEQAYQSLLVRFSLVLILLLILSGSMCVFLLRQVTLVRRQVKELSQFVADYEKTSLPLMTEFRDKLQAYGKTDRNFNAVLLRYFGTNNPPATTSAPPSVVAPSK